MFVFFVNIYQYNIHILPYNKWYICLHNLLLVLTLTDPITYLSPCVYKPAVYYIVHIYGPSGSLMIHLQKPRGCSISHLRLAPEDQSILCVPWYGDSCASVAVAGFHPAHSLLQVCWQLYQGRTRGSKMSTTFLLPNCHYLVGCFICLALHDHSCQPCGIVFK